jgi:bacteriocin-like protein
MNTQELSFCELQQINGGTIQNYSDGESVGKHARAFLIGVGSAVLWFSKVVGNILPG